jgi:hypothetical protein
MSNPSKGYASSIIQQEWWLAVRTIADLVSRDGVGPDDAGIIRKELTDRGFSTDGIGKALEWVDRAALSGCLMDTLGMLQPVADGLRVEHALERASLHPRLLRAIYAARGRGWISRDLSERLIEGVRTMDTRDWDDAEIAHFLGDILAVSSPCLAGQSLAGILAGRAVDHYN